MNSSCPVIALCGSLPQDSRRDRGAAGETGPVSHLSGDIPWPQGPGLPSRLLRRVHPAAAKATAERPGSGVSPVSQCCYCGRQWPQRLTHCVLHQWTDWSVWDIEKSWEQWDYLPELLQWRKGLLFLSHLQYVYLHQLYQCSQDNEGIFKPWDGSNLIIEGRNTDSENEGPNLHLPKTWGKAP